MDKTENIGYRRLIRDLTKIQSGENKYKIRSGEVTYSPHLFLILGTIDAVGFDHATIPPIHRDRYIKSKSYNIRIEFLSIIL
jgi:hypothetical protein